MRKKFVFRLIITLCFFNGANASAAFPSLKKAFLECRLIFSEWTSRISDKLPEYTIDVRDRKNRKKEILAQAASYPWKKRIGKWVNVKFISDDRGEERVEQAVHDSKSIAKDYSMVPDLARRAREESIAFGQKAFHDVGVTIYGSSPEDYSPEVAFFVVILDGKILYTSESFNSGERSAVSNEISEVEWEKMIEATRETFKWPVVGIPEILFIHTHPNAFSPVSPSDVAFAERTGDNFYRHFHTPIKVTVVASPTPNKGDFLFSASVRR